MCDVCESKLGQLSQFLKPFLKPSVAVVMLPENKRDGFQQLMLTDTTVGGKSAKITADSDEGPSYFHWEEIR